MKLAASGCLLALALSGCVSATSPPAALTPLAVNAEDEALYNHRSDDLTRAFATGLGLESYDPLETVPGVSNLAALPVAEAESETVSKAALAAARDYAAGTNSSALLIWRNGKLQSAEYFGATKRDTPIVARSLAKPLGAVAIGRAIKLGFIKSVDQPAADFITEWKGQPQGAILIRHLLDMRSGFKPQAEASRDRADVLNRAYLHPRHDEIIIREMPMTHAPGTAYEYANAPSEIVAPIIERATGMRYADFLSRHVIKPLGGSGGEIWINRTGGMAHSGCCIMLPAEDWMRLAVLVLKDGNWNGKALLPKGFVKDMRTGTPQNPWYGMGVYTAGTYRERRGFANERFNFPAVLHSEPYLAEDLFLFDGNGNQTAFIVPSADLVILRLGTSPKRPAEWDNAILPNTILRGIDFPVGQVPKVQPR